MPLKDDLNRITYFRWCHFDGAAEADVTPLVASTNMSEGVNSGINNGVRFCKNVNEQVACIREFKIKQIQKLYEIMHTNHWHPKKRSKTSERHVKLNEIVKNFQNLEIVHQCDHLIDTALEIGQLMMHTKRRL